MKIVTGVDLVFIPEFEKSLRRGGENFLIRVFFKEELGTKKINHLAGIFAAKEAIMKAVAIFVAMTQ